MSLNPATRELLVLLLRHLKGAVKVLEKLLGITPTERK